MADYGSRRALAAEIGKVMPKSANVRAIEEVMHAMGEPVRASQIARELGVPRSAVNAVLHEHMDTVFSKNTTDSTWSLVERARPPRAPRAPIKTSQTEVAAYFAPEDEPIGILCELIDDARSSILVQAYYLRSALVAEALIRAKQRSVSVRVLLGCTSSRSYASRDCAIRHGGSKHAVPKALDSAGIEVLEDHGDTNNHNKCMVIDDVVTVTGGLNFCDYAADNADNMVVIRSTAVADRFTRNWKRNWNHSHPFQEEVD